MRSWRVVGKEIKTRRGAAILCECVCGEFQYVNFYDLKRGRSSSCKSCAGKKRARRDKRTNLAAFKARCKKGAQERARTVRSKYTADELYVSRIMQGAKKRCEQGYKNYGARGIKFLFENVETAAKWVVKEIGARPSKAHSVDRIDNNGHYERGNLKWSTASEQVRNRRIKKPSPYGLRVLRLMAMRPDYTKEGIRSLIKRGLSDEEITTIKKTKNGRPRKC